MSPLSRATPPSAAIAAEKVSAMGPLGHDLALLLELTKKELRLRYTNSHLGYLWSVLSPLVQALVFFFAFKVVMRFPVEDYALFLLSALFPWQWFSNTVDLNASVYLSNGSLVKKVPFRRELLPLAGVLNNAVHFAATLPIMAALVLLYGRVPTSSWLWGVPLLMVSQIGVSFGIALIVSNLNVFFRDLQRLVQVALSILFFLTPIVYPVEMIPEKMRVLFLLNPMYGLITAWRTLFMDGLLDVSAVLSTLVVGAALLAVGAAVHRRVNWRVPEGV